jgi:hypothetical protein
MDHELMAGWLSVDPMADKYPNISPYAYCAWNPIKIIDPTGDTIKNCYEQYPNSDMYRRTQNLIDDFRGSHPDEFNYLDNLCFVDEEGNKTPINIVVGISDEYGTRNEEYGTRKGGRTVYAFDHMTIDQCDEENNIISTREIITGIKNNQFSITLYKRHHDIGTLANEFGDVIFAVARPSTVEAQKDWHYGQKATTNFSFDYEYFILGIIKERPNPLDKDKYRDGL